MKTTTYDRILAMLAADDARDRKAHKQVQYAIKAGKLVRQPCAKCGSTKNIHAHHADYNKPLDVEWLCGSCHQTRHLDEKAAIWKRIRADVPQLLVMSNAKRLQYLKKHRIDPCCTAMRYYWRQWHYGDSLRTEEKQRQCELAAQPRIQYVWRGDKLVKARANAKSTPSPKFIED